MFKFNGYALVATNERLLLGSRNVTVNGIINPSGFR